VDTPSFPVVHGGIDNPNPLIFDAQFFAIASLPDRRGVLPRRQCHGMANERDGGWCCSSCPRGQ
ncbi:MAG: hypothetical protein ACOH1R_12235, partial [Luteimonas sp.]